MWRFLLALAALLPVAVCLSINIEFGVLRYSIAGKSIRHWSLADTNWVFKPACAAGFIRSSGGPCSGNANATPYTLTDPTSGTFGVATSNYTVQANGATGVTITPADTTHKCIFTP